MTKINIQGSAGGGGGGGVTAVAVASGTTGTDVNVTGSPITSSGTITVNIPIASATNTGKLSSIDWAAFNGKQAALVSGTNIKTINGNTILGSGDLVVGGGTVSSVAVATGTTGTDVSVSGSPITSSGTITVNIPIASAGSTGKLSAADWIAFNGKQAAISLTTTGSSGAATLIGSTLNIPQYATTPSGVNGEIQYNNGGSTFGGALDFVWDDINNFLGIGIATPTKKVHVVDVANQCVGLFKSGVVGSGVAFMDISTLNADQVGVGAFDNLLCLRGGGNVAGTIQIGNDFANFRGHKLINFIPEIQTNSVSFTIDSTNQDNYCGAVAEVTGAITVTIDDSVRDGFSVSIIQMDANNCTLAASGALTLRNRQGHTQTNGQWATVTLFKNGANLILAGDTA
jgi:hypothetical protein